MNENENILGIYVKYLLEACVCPCKLDYPPHHNIVEQHCPVWRCAPDRVVVSLWISGLRSRPDTHRGLTFDEVADV